MALEWPEESYMIPLTLGGYRFSSGFRSTTSGLR